MSEPVGDCVASLRKRLWPNRTLGESVAAELYEMLLTMERPVFFVSAGLAVLLAVAYFPLVRNRMWGVEANPGLGLVRLSCLLAMAWFVWVLGHGADAGIFGFYTWLYVALAAACLLLMGIWRPMLGLWYIGDVVERGNLAAAITLAGFLLGTAFAFGGALTGQDLSCAPPRDALDVCTELRTWDPGTSYGYGGWYVVLVFFLLAYIELRASMALVHRLSGDLDTQVRLDRDPSAGILLAGVAVASGLVAGRAAAGDFLGWGDGLRDYFARLWPLALIPAVATLAGRISMYSAAPMRPRALTAALLVAGGGAYYVLT